MNAETIARQTPGSPAVTIETAPHIFIVLFQWPAIPYRPAKRERITIAAELVHNCIEGTAESLIVDEATRRMRQWP